MKKTIWFLMLVTGITGTVFAQNKATTDRTFELASNHASRRFSIDLGKGNKMQIELSNMEDLNRFVNMDSVLRVFIDDMAVLKDSLGEDVFSRRIDYIIDSTAAKKIRIQQFKPNGSSFLVKDGDLAALKLAQDTVNFIGAVTFTARPPLRKPYIDRRTYQVSFFINDLSDLSAYMDGSINAKIKTLQNNINTTWITTAERGTAFLKADRSISAKLTKGFITGGDFLNFRISVDVQNYKQYFVPSFSLGAGLILTNGNSSFKRDIVLSWDPHFFFAKDSQDKLKTFRNDFLTLTWGQGSVRDNDPRKESRFLFIMSAGYLIKREGNYFDKGTIRIGGGRLSIFEGKTNIEPVIYFNNFFKGVTPGLRWVQHF